MVKGDEGHETAGGESLAELEAQLLLLESLRAAERKPAEEALAPTPRRQALPLSFAQERLWFLHLLQPGSAAYNIPSSVHLPGGVDPPALAGALRAVVARHETLRTTFRQGEAGPVQIIAAAQPVSVPVLDLTGLAAGQAGNQASRLAAREAGRPFDLTRGPLLRALRLLERAEGSQLLLTVHHIVADGWSMAVLERELLAAYSACRAGLPSSLPPLRIQYADYAAWQRRRLSGEVLAGEVAFWRRRLNGLPPLLELPLDRPRPETWSGRGGVLGFRLPAAIAAAVRRLAQEREATPFMVLLAAFQAFLSRCTGQTDLAVGAPVAGRLRPETEPLVGLFVNTLVLRGDLTGDPTFRTLLDRARQAALEALAHQEVPFEKLVEELVPRRSLAHAPLLQALLVHEDAVQDGGRHRASAVLRGRERIVGGAREAKFDLTLAVVERADCLEASLEYAADLFDATTVRRWSGHLEELLGAALADPSVSILDLPLLSPAERHQVVVEWGDRDNPPAPSRALDSLFATWAAATPDATAVTAPEGQMSYGELQRRARRLSWELLSRGLQPGSRVGLFCDREAGLVVAILGVLEAGCAYLPLEPSYPEERLTFALEDSGAQALVTAASLRDRLPRAVAEAGVPRVEIGPEGELSVDGAARSLPSSPPRAAAPEEAAYVIYTSGSTGQPKGVVVTHRNVVRLLEQTAPFYRFGPGEVWALFHSYAFDFSVWELWGALAFGARLVVVPYAVSRSPEAFHRLLAAERVTVLNQTPSAFRQLIWAEEQAGQRALALRWVIFGGEALDPGGLRPWRQRHGDREPALVNMYGITETTVHVTLRPIGREAIEGGRGSAIGRALPDLSIYLADRRGRPVPVGISGEIWVGGAGLAPGYLGRPGLTAQRFGPESTPLCEGGRSYRSGDLARWLPDGDLEYQGRIDFQIKIRGFRIELGEIEAVLAARTGVREVAVVVRGDLPEDRRLVAYVAVSEEGVEDEGARLGASQLRRHAASLLPDYMVPAAFVLLPALPLTANGKVDREALAMYPAEEASASSAVASSPRDRMELVLSGIWEELLERREVGLGDDFFALGGHSLLAIRLVAAVESRLGLRLPVADLFRAPTLEGLASLLRRRAEAARQGGGEEVPEVGASALASTLVSLRPGPGQPLFLVHPVGGTVLCYFALARRLEGPLFAFQAPGVEGGPPPEVSIEGLAALYVQELVGQLPVGPARLGGWSLGGVVAFEMARQLTAAGREVSWLGLVDAPPPSRKKAPAGRQGAVVEGLDEAALLLRFGRELGLRGEKLPLSREELRGLSGSELLAEVGEAVRSAGLLPADLDDRRLGDLYRVFSGNLRALASYRPGRPWSGQAVFFQPAASASRAERPGEAWRRWVAGGVRVEEVPGDHFTALEAPQVEELARCLQSSLP